MWLFKKILKSTYQLEMKFNWQIKMDQVPRMLAEMLTELTVSELIPWFAFEGQPVFSV